MIISKTASLGLVLASGCLVSAADQSFGLYAYGDSIGGLPMYYYGGNAIVASNPPSNASRVAFTKGTGGLVGNPNTTNSTGNPQFSNQFLFVPGPDDSTHQMGFTGEGSTNKITSKFVWYGNFLLVENDQGEYTSLYSVKKGETSESHSLLWNATDEGEDVVPITVRSIAPSTDG